MALDPAGVVARLNASRTEDMRQAEIMRAKSEVTRQAEAKRAKSLSFEACDQSDDTRSAPNEPPPKPIESPKAADSALRSAKELTVLRNQQLKIMQTYMNGADCTYSWTLLHECVSLGLTNTVRQQFWLMQSIESEQPVPPSIDELLAGGELPRVVYNQVLTDLYRTVPEVAQARPDIINDLYRGLVAHAILRPDIGYVQGMNCLWAPIILYITKPNHRLIMAEHIVRRILPHYFTTDMIGAMIDARVLGHYLHRLCPNLEARLCEALQMKRSDVRDMLTTICSTYFPTLYARNIKLDICMRLWDLIMLHGPVALFEFTLRLLIYGQKHGWLAKCGNWVEFMQMITTNLAELETLDKLLDVQIPEHNIIVNDFNCRRKASARTVFIGMSMIES